MSDTTAVNNTEKGKYTSGVVYKIIIAMTFLIAFGLIMVASTSEFQRACYIYRYRYSFGIFLCICTIWMV